MSDNTITGTSLEVLSFIVGGIEQSQNFNDGIDGRSRLFQGSEDKYRKITLMIRASAEYLQRVAHLRDAVNDLFSGEYYIREMRIKAAEVKYESPGQKTGNMNLGTSEYVNGKQFKVKKVSSIESDDLLESDFTVELETTDLPYAESIYTTKELNDSGYDAVAAKYGLVDNIHVKKTQYVFTEDMFTVYNAGNVPVEPEFMDLNITIGLLTTPGNFRLRNTTTGETFVWDKSVTDRNIYLRGMTVTEGTAVNGLRSTNRKFIRLAPGDNQFEIWGGTFSQVTFDFKYYYK